MDGGSTVFGSPAGQAAAGPAGNPFQIQYHDTGGVFGATSEFYYTPSTGILNVGDGGGFGAGIRIDELNAGSPFVRFMQDGAQRVDLVYQDTGDWLALNDGTNDLFYFDLNNGVFQSFDPTTAVGIGILPRTGALEGGVFSVDSGNMYFQSDTNFIFTFGSEIRSYPGDGSAAIYGAMVHDGATMVFDEAGGSTGGYSFIADRLQFGTPSQRLFEATNIVASVGGFELYPDAFTITGAGGTAFTWSSALSSDIPGGGGIGNDTAPNFVTWGGEITLLDQGNLFNTQSLFNQATIVTCQGANTGPIYTMINQPLLRTGSTGGSRTGSQQNAVRSQLRLGPNVAGNFTLTSHEPFFATVIANATVGTVSLTTCNYFAPKAPTLTAGATIGTLNCMDIPNIPAGGITNLRGINSAMSAGTFINHTGTANADFGGNIRVTADIFGLVLGASQDWSYGWAGAGFAFEQQNTGVVEQMQKSFPAAGRMLIDWSNDMEYGINCVDGFSFGAQTGGNGNQFGNFVAGARTTQIAGEWSDFLLTQAANLTVDDAMGLVAGWTINAPSMTLGTGTVTTAGALNVGGNVNQGSVNRFGIRVLSNPSGGSGVNAALWITAGLSRFDGRVDINNGIALGGGAAATLGTIGGSGPTTAAQAQWVEIDIGGTAHWIAVWT